MSLSLFLRNLLFTILLPGTVTILIPYILLGDERSLMLEDFPNFNQLIALALILPGAYLLLNSVWKFGSIGKGTPAPIDPTLELVVSGFYKYSRNPMYLGVLTILLGESIWMKSYTIILYAIIVLLVFNLFIQFIEEPRLKKSFGEKYTDYCYNVRRWL